MSNVSIHIEHESDLQAGLRFEEFPDELRDALRNEISALTREAFGRYRSRVPVRTGKLLGQVREAVHSDPDKVRGAVYIDGKGSGGASDFAKAGALEYGSTGKKFKVSGGPLSLDHVFEEHLAAPMVTIRKAYRRASSIMEHAFARGTIEAMAPEIKSRLEAVVSRAVADAND